jgi:lipoprotein NlpI
MRFSTLLTMTTLFAGLVPTPTAAGADKVDDVLAQAQKKIVKGQFDEALKLADRAVALDRKNIKGYVFRAKLFEVLRKYKEALADYDRTLKISPRAAEVYNWRGAVHFKLGHVKKSISDFDRYIKLEPKAKNGHWMRGISYYYAGRFEEGRKQFEGYESVDTNDVENAVWHFLCVARSDGVAKARKSMLKIGKDSRVPMMEVYALYRGKAKPADVLNAANKVEKGAKPELKQQQLFYAHLYLGLYYEVTGDKKRALEHMTRAAKDYVIGHYMGDVARVHLRLLQKEAKSKG